MPQVSSIIKNRDDTTNVNSSFPKDDGLSKGLEHPIKAGSFLALSIHAGFPMVDIPRTYGAAYHRITKNGNEKYSLGTGVSCSVHRFTLDHVINSSFPAGDVVALKHYSSRGDDYSVKNIRKWLWNELKVFRHPYLRAQENICQLRVIGWEEDNLVPLLGLELAQYGTLADCLQDIRSYSTDMRKAHIMLDIALGLQAIHSVKLVHGDLKPANIIVCVHHDDSRKIIAKLSDFGGVSPADTYEHEFGTTLWEAPEVLLKEANINWQLADVYSFGMVLATLWSPRGWIPPGGSFMDPHIGFELKDSDKARVLEGLKFNPDHEPRSLLRTALEAHDEDGSPLLSLVSDVFRGSLPTLPECRKTMLQLLKYFKPFAESTGRVIDSPPHPRDIDPSHWIDTSAEISVVLDDWFMARPSIFKKAMFQAIRSEALALDRSVTIPPVSDIERDFEGDAEDLAERLRKDSRRLNRSLNTKLLEFADCAFDVAVCYLLGMGTLVDEEQALHWLGRAALAGEGNSILFYSPIEESVGSRSQVVLPRKLWCAYGLRAGVTANVPPLKELDPDLYSRAQYLHQNSYARRIIPRGRRIQPYLTSLMESIRQDATIVDQEIRDSRGVGGRS